MAKVSVQLVGFEFKVIAADSEKLILSDESGQLYEVNALPVMGSHAELEYYRMKAEVLEIK